MVAAVMSELGHERRFSGVVNRSVHPPTADIAALHRKRRKVPQARFGSLYPTKFSVWPDVDLWTSNVLIN